MYLQGKLILINPSKSKKMLKGSSLVDSGCIVLDVDNVQSDKRIKCFFEKIEDCKIEEVHEEDWKRNQYHHKNNRVELSSVLNMIHKKDIFYLIPISAPGVDDSLTRDDVHKFADDIRTRKYINDYSSYEEVLKLGAKLVGSVMSTGLFEEESINNHTKELKNDIIDFVSPEDMEFDIFIRTLKGNIDLPIYSGTIIIRELPKNNKNVKIDAPNASISFDYLNVDSITLIRCDELISSQISNIMIKKLKCNKIITKRSRNSYTIIEKLEANNKNNEVYINGPGYLEINKTTANIKKSSDATNVKVKDENKVASSSLKGKTIVITGDMNSCSRNDFVSRYFEPNGILFGGSITKKTDYLINNDIYSNSSKNKKAKELGIPIITEQDFLNMI